MTGAAMDGPLVGRAAQLSVLRAALRTAGEDGTAAVFLTGESGVGKTRLLAEAVEEMRAAGVVVLAGQCLDIGDASPLYPLRQALRRFSATAPAGSGATARDAASREAAIRDLLALLDGGDAGPDGAGALLDRLSGGLGAISDGQPLVLAIDDLQWADRTTRQLLLYLLAGLGDLRLLLLGAVRAETLQGADPLRLMMTELRRMRAVRVLELGPLDRAETARLSAAIMGRPLTPETDDLVWERSGGNPFIVEELVRHARAGKAGLSDTLREIVFARVDALPPHVHTVAYALAAGVEPVEHGLLAEVVPLDEEQLNDALRIAVSQRVLAVADDGYRFHHRLIKEVLEPRLLPGEALGLHRRYAEALTAAPPAALQHARLAHHWELAREPARALSAAAAAAEEAERLYGFEEAYEHWSQALRLAADTRLPGDIDVNELRQRAAEAAHRCGEHDRALALLEELAKAATADPPPWLHTRRARYLAAVGRPAEAEAEYERALGAADGGDSERVTAAAHSAELLLHLGRYVDAGRRAREALALAAQAPDSASSAVLASAALGFSQAYLDDPAAGIAAVEQALRTAERSGSVGDVAGAYLHLAELLSGPLNELEKGIAVAREGAERADQLGLGRTYGTRLLAVVANGLFRAGRWAEAEKVIATALRHRPAGTDAVELLLSRCRISVGYGDLDGAERDLEAIETLLAGGGPRHVLPLLTLRAGLAMWRGQFADARRAVQQALDPAVSRSDDVWLLAPVVWHGLRAEAEAVANGVVAAYPGPDADPETDTGPGGAAVARLRQVADEITASSTRAARPVRDAVAGYQALCEAEISRLEGHSDPAAWARAAEIWQSRHHPYPAAYALLRQADALYSQRTRNADAATALRAAHRTAGRLGAQPFIREIRALADRARVQLDEPDQSAVPPAGSPSPEVPEHADELAGLTDRELQVLTEVAAGRTNQEIADLLFISQRTVGVHVSRILHKLQVRTRVQATSVYLRSQPPAR